MNLVPSIDDLRAAIDRQRERIAALKSAGYPTPQLLHELYAADREVTRLWGQITAENGGQ